MAVTKKQNKPKRQVEHARVHITATFNNTIITIADQSEQPIVVASTGMHQFIDKKSTPHAATITAGSAMQKAVSGWMHGIDVYVRGIGPGREASIRALKVSGCDVEKVVDVTPVPHNGVRPPKIRRV